MAIEMEAKFRLDDVQAMRMRLSALGGQPLGAVLEHMATEQMKIAIMSDGGVAMTAEKMNQQYSQFADDLQHAKRDASVENWGK